MRRNGLVAFCGSALLMLGLTGCRTDMWVQQKVEAQSNSEFYALTSPVVGFDGKVYGDGSRPMPPNTIARGRLQDPNDPLLTGKDAQGNQIDYLPKPLQLTREFLARGEQQYNSFCSPCHGRAGDGRGMIALRGQWPRMPSSLISQRVQNMPLGYYYAVGKNGFGIMYGYGTRMTTEDLWAVAAYIRVLQENARMSGLDMADVPATTQQQALKP
ncbi:MAG: cytochrome c [Fimbriimonadales bacterium]